MGLCDAKDAARKARRQTQPSPLTEHRTGQARSWSRVGSFTATRPAGRLLLSPPSDG